MTKKDVIITTLCATIMAQAEAIDEAYSALAYLPPTKRTLGIWASDDFTVTMRRLLSTLSLCEQWDFLLTRKRLKTEAERMWYTKAILTSMWLSLRQSRSPIDTAYAHHIERLSSASYHMWRALERAYHDMLMAWCDGDVEADD